VINRAKDGAFDHDTISLVAQLSAGVCESSSNITKILKESGDVSVKSDVAIGISESRKLPTIRIVVAFFVEGADVAI
jgi:hypothetical protein